MVAHFPMRPYGVNQGVRFVIRLHRKSSQIRIIFGLFYIIFGATISYRYHDLDTLADFLFTASHPPRNINSDKELHSSIFILSREHNLSFLTSARLADQVKVVGSGLKSDFFRVPDLNPVFPTGLEPD